jgi:hypothetical protein
VHRSHKRSLASSEALNGLTGATGRSRAYLILSTPKQVCFARRRPSRSLEVELTKTKYAGSTRFAAATALLDRGYGRPAQSLDLHLSADAITKRLSDMTDAELAALEQRMIAAAPIVLEATAEVSDDAGELPDGDADAGQGW